MDSNAVQPIIVKRVKKGGHGGHHGGSWKVAYADFVTAMMALFLLLWLLETTPKEDLKAMEGYFQSPSMIQAAGGASSAVIDMGGGMDAPKGEGGTILKTNPEESSSAAKIEDVESREKSRSFDDLMQKLKEHILSHPTLHSFKDQIYIDVTEEGLRIQIVDQKNRPMFDSGKARFKAYARVILREIGKVLSEVPNKISITGHTDSRPYTGKKNYSNWELSSDRANAARRELISNIMDEERIIRVVGLADSEPFLPDDPDAPINRRISIVVTDKKIVDSFNIEEHKPVAEELSEQLGMLPAVTPVEADSKNRHHVSESEIEITETGDAKKAITLNLDKKGGFDANALEERLKNLLDNPGGH